LRSRGLGRLARRAAGLGIGAALAAAPWVASADSSNDWWSSIDQLLGGLPVPAADTVQHMQISIDGTPLIYGPNTAWADSDVGPGDIAIAIGDNSYATAAGGPFDFAFADGGMAEVSDGSFDVAVADGNGSVAEAGGYGGGTNFDTALVFGDHSIAEAGFLGVNNGGSLGVGYSDLAAVYGDNLSAYATATPYLVDIVPQDVPFDQVVSSWQSLLSTLESLLPLL
jgi:hypothetical protein